MEALTFTVPGKPQPKQRARKGKHGWYTPNETREYEARVRYAALTALCSRPRGRLPWRVTGGFALELVIVFPDRRRRDSDNVEKALKDAMNGLVWDDDAHVYADSKRVEFDAENPRVEVTVRRIEQKGRA